MNTETTPPVGACSAAHPSGSDRRLIPVRARRDMPVSKQSFQGRSFWVVKDPVQLVYHRLPPEEYALWRWLDGETTVDELRARFHRAFRPQRIDAEEIARYIESLERRGLVVSDHPGGGERLRARRRAQGRTQALAGVFGFLGMRWRGVDPSPFLDALYPLVRWIYSPLMLTVWAALVVSAAALVTVHFGEFQARLPEFREYFSVSNVVLLIVVLSLTKVLHEFGHALTNHHFGGRCHEMGFMLLVFTPCLYCDVSDSWMLPSKWQRMAIGAGGMAVELVLAAAAAWVWWFTERGVLHYACLNVMLVCSVSTLAFNGNPLMRYDGYYLLADFLEIPNLRQRAGEALRRAAAYVIFGEPADGPSPWPERGRVLFGLYAVAAAVYRWVILVAIAWLLHRLFAGHPLEVVGNLLLAVMLVSVALAPAVQLIRLWRSLRRNNAMKTLRMVAALTVMSVCVWLAISTPLPHRVACVVEVQPVESTAVYVDVGGRLDRIHARPGERVTGGAPIVTLVNDDVDLDLVALQGQIDRRRVRIESLEMQRFRDEHAGAEIAEAREALAAIEETLNRRVDERDRLVVRAPRDGVVLPVPATSTPPEDARELASWSGRPTDEHNLGATLQEGTPLCRVGDPRRMEAILVIDEHDVELVGVGDEVDLFLEAWPWRRLRGQIVSIAEDALESSPATLSTKTGGRLATFTDEHGRERPMNASYVARVALQWPDDRSDNDSDDAAADKSAERIDRRRPADLTLIPGMRGVAMVETGSSTLAARCLRWIHTTARFRW